MSEVQHCSKNTKAEMIDHHDVLQVEGKATGEIRDWQAEKASQAGPNMS
jgi:hypothetical protein